MVRSIDNEEECGRIFSKRLVQMQRDIKNEREVILNHFPSQKFLGPT